MNDDLILVLLDCLTIQAKLEAFHQLQMYVPDTSGLPALPEGVRQQVIEAMGRPSDEELIAVRDCLRENIRSHFDRALDPMQDPDKKDPISDSIHGHEIDEGAHNDTPAE